MIWHVTKITFPVKMHKMCDNEALCRANVIWVNKIYRRKSIRHSTTTLPLWWVMILIFDKRHYEKRNKVIFFRYIFLLTSYSICKCKLFPFYQNGKRGRKELKSAFISTFFLLHSCMHNHNEYLVPTYHPNEIRMLYCISSFSCTFCLLCTFVFSHAFSWEWNRRCSMLIRRRWW